MTRTIKQSFLSALANGGEGPSAVVAQLFVQSRVVPQATIRQPHPKPLVTKNAPTVLAIIMMLAICATRPAKAATYNIAADHHIHIFSPATVEQARLLSEQFNERLTEEAIRPSSAETVLKLIDAAGIRKGLLLSTAYLFGTEGMTVLDEHKKVSDENRWVAEQARSHANRFAAFCSVNPLRSYALDVLDECHALRVRGVKMHLGNADFKFDNPAHVQQLRGVFAKANTLRLAIVIHMRTLSKTYGAQDVQVFIRDVLPAASRIPVQIAHMAGFGGYDQATDDALGVFASACGDGAPICKHLYFDISCVIVGRDVENSTDGTAWRVFADMRKAYPEGPSRLATRIRQLGLRRILFASDWPATSPLRYHKALQDRLQLNSRELAEVFQNTSPVLK